MIPTPTARRTPKEIDTATVLPGIARCFVRYASHEPPVQQVGTQATPARIEQHELIAVLKRAITPTEGTGEHTMPQVVELRVLISSSDDRADAADRIEAQVRRNLHRDFDAHVCYVERITPSVARRG